MSFVRQVREMPITRVSGSRAWSDTDCLAAEEPLEIRVEGHAIAVVMRTPGEDRELAAGFLVTEGLLHRPCDVLKIEPRMHCQLPLGIVSSSVTETSGSGRKKNFDSSANFPDGNIIDVHLKNPEGLDLKKFTRHVFTSSSCGICSKASIAAVQTQFPPISDECQIARKVLADLPQSLSAAQHTFKRTGGLHACALFDLAGRLVVLREDVGRHNALDKVIGWAFLEGRLPLREHVLLLSGRTSFEMLQKALAAGIPIVAAISAPSSLAAQFASDCGQTLVGFLREDKMNVYAGAARVYQCDEPSALSCLGK